MLIIIAFNIPYNKFNLARKCCLTDKAPAFQRSELDAAGMTTDYWQVVANLVPVVNN